MFNLQGSEIIFILLLALVVLGPEKLPGAIKRAMQTYAELRKLGTGFQDEFRSAIDEPLREMRQTADMIKEQVDPAKIAADAQHAADSAAEAAAAADRADAALAAEVALAAEIHADDVVDADPFNDPFDDPVVEDDATADVEDADPVAGDADDAATDELVDDEPVMGDTAGAGPHDEIEDAMEESA